MKAVERVMWNGTCNHLDLKGQLQTAQLSGCEVLSIAPFDFKRWRDAGLPARDMLAMARDSGVKLNHLDPIATWAPKWVPDNVPEESMPFFGLPVDEFFAIADQLECVSLSANCTFPYGSVPMDELIAAFSALCERAGGLRVDLEFVPLWGLPDLAMAWNVVGGANAPNGGIMFDFWHFFRSNPDFDLLGRIPVSKIHAVQLCDAKLARDPGRTPLEDCLEDRCPLGEGEFDVARMLQTLSEKDALTRVGPEYFSRSMHVLSPLQIADVVQRTCWDKLDRLEKH